MLDCLAFLHYLHDFLLGHSLDFISGNSFNLLRSLALVPNPYVGAESSNPAPALNLEARNVLCLKAFRTLLDFELHRLSLV
jgi:hypothetical protein